MPDGGAAASVEVLTAGCGARLIAAASECVTEPVRILAKTSAAPGAA